jgi:peptidylprolyl isomerase
LVHRVLPSRAAVALLFGLPLGLVGCSADGCKSGAQTETKKLAAEEPAAKPAANTNTNANLEPPADLETPPADAETTESGLITKVLKRGVGDKRPKPHDSVRVHFTGWKTSGALIDSSHERDGAVTFQLDGVIRGWAEGLQMMRVREKRRLWIPPHLGYIRPGRPPSTVVFDIELLEIIEGQARPAPQNVTAPPKTATTTKSGLAYTLLKKSEADEKPHAWDHVTVSYAGWSIDGEMFEASSKASFDLSEVMPGWAELLPQLATGDRVLAWIPQDLAYRGRSARPKGMVLFEIELLSIERRPEPPRAPKDVAAPPASAKRTQSGLAYRVVQKGDGTARPKATSRVQIHYSGWSSDGKLFDSTTERGRPKPLPLSAVIPGWREGLQLMTEGDKLLFWIPETLAYGGKGSAPKGTLVYELELLKVLE